MPQTFPFSYFERFYANATRYAKLGTVLFFLSLGGVLLMAGGAVLAMRGFAGNADPPRRFMACCGVLMVCVITPQVLWNPHVMDAVNDNFRVPVRYFVVMWPAQFALLGGGWWWLVENRRRLRQAAGGVLAVFCAGSLLLMYGFHRHAARTGEPFNYIFMSWPVHTLRDKLALARHLVDQYGVTEADLLTRVHTHDVLFIISEESIDFELRTALEANPRYPVGDPSLYYFLHKPEDHDRVVVPGEIIERANFGGVALVVYRPDADLSAWQPDAPISWYWY